MLLDKEETKKVLFIANHRPNRSPGQRFRFEQYIPLLEKRGIACDFSYLINKSDDKALYARGKYLRKILILLKSYFIRFRDLLRANQYDYIFIFREALLTGSNFFEKRFQKSTAKIIFDFDDAIWLLDTSKGNKNLEWLKNVNKTRINIKLADVVITGNNYLAEYAKKYSMAVNIIPTTIDTLYHVPNNTIKTSNKICIGWTGSQTTVKHFEMLTPVLEILKEKYNDRIYFKLIGDKNYSNSRIGLNGNAWSLNKEIEELNEIDIGIMPLPNDEWSKGKCGFKGLQYMSLEIPTVMSPVGVNSEIIEDGVNGFLASTEEEWVQKISLLVDSENLRTKLGRNGRITVQDNYSVHSQSQKYFDLFK